MRSQFSRTSILLGDDAVSRLQAARVAVFGIGGVGSFAAEALARSGIGAIDLIDGDDIHASNLNRQLPALHSTLGKPKVDVIRERLLDINPDCTVTARKTFFGADNAADFDFAEWSYIVDAIDMVSAKILLVEMATAKNVPIISCMGAGNKLDPTRFEVADICETQTCPLARVMRRELSKRGIKKLKTVYSKEPPIAGKQPTIGSVVFVTSVAGLILAGEVIKELAAPH